MPAIDPTTLGEATERAMQRLEMRIMRDIVRRIRDAEFSTASADWQISRLQQLGHAEEQVKEWVQDALGASDEEIEEIFSDEVYRSYVGNEPAYRHTGKQQTPYSENYPLQQTVRAMHEQTSGTLKNITRSMGFVEVLPGTRRTRAVALTDFYRQTLDDAIYDIQSGAFDYTSVLKRTVSTMTRSGIRQIDYASGPASRIDVAARRAVMTGFRQVQGKISEQTAAELGTDTFEVSYHGGARPSHAEWQGGVYTKQELTDICGLGDVTGLCGANCYHTYWPFIPGVDKPVYSADELERMRAQDQQARTYQGKAYTPYEATQAQRDLERRMRKDEEDLYLLREGGADEETLALKEAHLNGLRQTYSSFSDRMELPKHWERARAMDPDRTVAASTTGEWRSPSVITPEGAVIDYAEADRLAGGDKKLYSDLMSGDVQRISSAVNKVLEQMDDSLPQSCWSGVTVIGDKSVFSEGAVASAYWDRVIRFKPSYIQDIKTHIHEQLHMRSVILFGEPKGPILLAKYRGFEEGCVELLAQEICKRKTVGFRPSYSWYVDSLKTIRQTLFPEYDDYGFALMLFDMPLEKRYYYLKKQIETFKHASDKKHSASVHALEEAFAQLRRLRGR